MPRPAADTDTTKHPGTFTIPGSDLPLQLDLWLEGKKQRDRNLSCSSLEAAQISALSGCGVGFLPIESNFRFTLKSAGTIADRFHVNVDYDMQREFDASNTVTVSYEGKPGEHLKSANVGNIDFVAPSSRFIASSLPSGNYGFQSTWQFGRVEMRTIFARQMGNVVQSRRFDIGARAQANAERDVEDNQLERMRFFFTIDPRKFGRAYPNVDILDRAQMASIRGALPDTLRPTRVLVYRLQFSAAPQNPNGPRFRLQEDPPQRRQTYDLLREGVDYYMDRSMLWFALVRPLNETERLVVAYNVRVNGRDTVWVTTGGTPDLQVTTAHDQVANLVMDPTVSPSSPAFRNEIRSVYRLGGEELVRQSTQVRVVTGSGLLEHPIAGAAATFLQMFGLAQSTNPAEFDYQNRVWPRQSDPNINLGGGAVDVRNGQSTDAAKLFHDYFIVFPSLRPFSARDSGLVVAGNPTNDAIYSVPSEYLYSVQHPASVYRLRLKYQTIASDNSTAIMLGASQMRPGSERVLLDGRPLVRELDYRIDYDLGRVEFVRPDTLFALPRHVDVSFEENPTFTPTPTALAGIVSQLPVSHGVINFAAINQSQSTPFTRPQLGFQGTSTLTTGITSQFDWDAPMLSMLAAKLPFGDGKTASHISLRGEVASSLPQFAARNNDQAFIETFEGAAGLSIALGDEAWQYSSMPAYGHSLRSAPFSPNLFEPRSAATLVWQTNAKTPTGRQLTIRRSQIDPLVAFAGTGFEFNEPLLWLSLLPSQQLGRYNNATKSYDWTDPTAPIGQRWRSIVTTLSPSGVDLTGDELLQFWTLVDTTTAGRVTNPTLVFDFGDVSENALRFGPQSLTVSSGGRADSLFAGRVVRGIDTLNTERDPFSHQFNADVNDTGLPGDVDTMTVVNGASVSKQLVHVCRGARGALNVLGDPATNCTFANSRLDEEDIDQDNSLNFLLAQRESERVLRYVVDLTDPGRYRRFGKEYKDTVYVRGIPQPRTRQWVLVTVPFKTPTDSLNDVNRRRIRALRLTVVSGARASDDEQPVQLPLAELQVTGAPWLARSNHALPGVGGAQPDEINGFVVVSSIGTNDSTGTLVYQPPPGLSNQSDTKNGQFQSGLTQINERSMRIQAGNLPLYHRAETFFRFPAGPQNYMAFKQLSIWGRGRGNGWGVGGDLQMYVKVGRDENNFYLYRTPVNAGNTQAAWSDVTIDFSRFIALRRQLETSYLAGKQAAIACTGIDSAIAVASPLPVGQVSHRFAACDGSGYMVYTIDPAVTAPNLAAVQEIAVGLIRTGATAGGSTIVPGDTLELWVDDVRLDHQANTPGYAGQLSMTANLGGLADIRVTTSNKDPNFRALGEQPTFLAERTTDIASTIHVEQFFSKSLGLALPLTVTRTSIANDPLYLSQTDIPGHGISGLRKPQNAITTYALTVRRSSPIEGGILAPLLNNLSATSSYVSGVDRTEYQDGRAHNFNVTVDYLVTDDSARTIHLPGWFGGVLGALPSVLQAGPIDALKSSAFRWNPTQLRFTTGMLDGTDHRTSFIKPAGAADDQPSTSEALSKLWRSGGVVELRPTNGTTVRWELESVRDLRDYGDTSTLAMVASRERRSLLGGNAGFERERSMMGSFSIAPVFSSWFQPRAELGTQYSMLRDPNVRSLVTLPGVIGVDSVLAARDSMALASSFTLPRRMTAAQTSSIGSTIQLAKAFGAYTRDSSVLRRIGGLFAPMDVSYTRSLITTLDASPVDAPLLLQLGLGGQDAYRSVRGVDATTAGQTGVFAASSALLLPLRTSVVNRYQRTTTANWIARPDASPSNVGGEMTRFPDATVSWAYQPAQTTGLISNLAASVGYLRSAATVELPSFLDDAPPDVRRTHTESFPIGGTIAWSIPGGLSTGAQYAFTRRIDSLPGSTARAHTNEVSVDAGRAFRVPSSWGLGLRSDVRTHASFHETHNTTFVFDPSGEFQSRLRDDGEQGFNLTADTNLQENMTFTLQGSHKVTFDRNLNRRFAQTVFSVVLHVQLSGR